MAHRSASFFIAASLLLLANAQTPLTPEQYEALKVHNALPADPVIITQPGTGVPVHPSAHDRSGGGACDCWIEPDSTYMLAMGPNDDQSTSAIPLPFTFYLFGHGYDMLYINNNGNVSFGSPYGTFTAEGFPSTNYVMVAPFWADVETIPVGQVWYKLTPTAMYVNWSGVGYFNQHTDKLNSFQLVLTNGTDPIVPNGANVSFCYHDMQWTTGDASAGVNGFGGTPATVGANSGNGINYAQIGRFDHPGTDYDGPFNNADGVSWLDSTHFYFDVQDSAGVPPIFGSTFGCDTVVVPADLPFQYEMLVIAGGPGQTIVASSECPTLSSYAEVNNTSGALASITSTVQPSASDIGMHTVTYTAHNDALVPQTSVYHLVLEVVQSTVGIDGPAKPGSLTILPNPATDNVIVGWPNNGKPSLIEVIALDGQVVKTLRPVSGADRMIIDLNGLDAGAYFIRATNAGATTTSRLIKVAR